MRNKYSKEFEETMRELAPTTNLHRLLWYAYSQFGYSMNIDMLRQYLYKRNIKYKDYYIKRAHYMNKIPIGTEHIKPDGMTVVKISNNKWEYKQRLIYEKKYGKLPKGMYVIFLDGNRNNFDINNLKAISNKTSSYMANNQLFSKNKKVTELGIDTANLIIKTKEKQNDITTNDRK